MELQIRVVMDHIPELHDHEPVEFTGGSIVDQPAGELAGEVSVEPADELALVPVCGHGVSVVKNVQKDGGLDDVCVHADCTAVSSCEILNLIFCSTFAFSCRVVLIFGNDPKICLELMINS